MDVRCSSCWVQFRGDAEYPGHLCHKKIRAHDTAHDSEAKKNGEKENKKKIRHNSGSPQDQVCHGTYVITQVHHKIRFATAHPLIKIST